VKQLTAW